MGKQNEACNGIKLEKTMGLVTLILAIAVYPGGSTIFAGIMESGRPNLNNALVVGLIQMFTVWLLVGWIWAIMTGWKIYNNSK